MTRSGEHARVRGSLLERIVGGEYPPGTRLPAEADLARELGCGRSTIREALTSLGSLGVVVSRRGSGAHVLDWKRGGSPALLPHYLASPAGLADAPRLLDELLEMRGLLAKEAVRLAARHSTPTTLVEVHAALAASERATDSISHALLELDFWKSLVVSSQVWPAVWFTNALFAPLREVHGALAPFAGDPPDDYAQTMHRLLEKIEARDGAAAEKLLDTWLDKVDRGLRGRLQGAFGATTPAPQKKKRSNEKRTS